MISLSSITSQSYLLINAELDKLLLSYGLIILSFMAGTHWGFAAKSSGVLSTKAYLSSVIPTFLVFLIIPEHFFSVSHNIKLSLALLLIGFLGILLFDVHHWKEKLANKPSTLQALSLQPNFTALGGGFPLLHQNQI